MDYLQKIKKDLLSISDIINSTKLKKKKAVVKLRKKFSKLERDLQSIVKFTAIKSNEFIINDYFEFLGYYKLDSRPVYKYVGNNYEEDIKRAPCAYETIFVEVSDLMPKSNLKLADRFLDKGAESIARRLQWDLKSAGIETEKFYIHEESKKKSAPAKKSIVDENNKITIQDVAKSMKDNKK